MKAIMVMFDSLNRRMLSAYGCENACTPNFSRLTRRAVTFDNCYIGSMPCMPARRELHTGRYNFLHRSWGPLEPFDDSMPEILKKNGIYTHLVSDHQHYWEDGGATYHTRYNSWEISRGQEGDPWKGHVKDPDMSMFYQSEKDRLKKKMMRSLGMPDLNRNDVVNRQYLQDEKNMPQAVTFRNGLEFLEKNHDEDQWFLQIETFDPHEPFFASERFRALYPDPDYTGKEFDWPPYAKVTQTPEEVLHCRKRYQALVAMCDYYLGTVLDAMDQYNLWDDTLLIVNTDHGFLLGEHGWWAKSVMPYYNEIAHIPMFIWDPRSKVQGERRKSLVQNIDVAPTILEYFGLKPTKDMLGRSLAQTIKDDTPVRKYALFGSHGNYINITDGTYVYMISPRPDVQVNEYTLMPTHMRSRFSVSELQGMELAQPFSFTKNCKVLKIPAAANVLSAPPDFERRLYCLTNDPCQLSPIEDPNKEVEFAEQIRCLMKENEAPEELYAAYRLSPEHEYTIEDWEKQKQNPPIPVIPGLEEFEGDFAVFRQMQAISMAVSHEQMQVLLKAMRSRLKEQGKQKITAEFVVSFAERLPMDENVKKYAVSLLKNFCKSTVS